MPQHQNHRDLHLATSEPLAKYATLTLISSTVNPIGSISKKVSTRCQDVTGAATSGTAYKQDII